MRRFAPSIIASIALPAAALTGLAAPAAAQRVDRVVAFGDSYADNGNFFRLAGLVPFPAPYPLGRFSNATNFVDTISTGLGVPQLNFAIGGATTGTTNVNPGAPGFTQEYQGFVASGGSFTPNDLLAISVGGNDARAYRLGGGSVAGAGAAAAVSVTQLSAGLDALVARGARQIVFTAGDVGLLPEALGQPSAAAGTAFSTAYNNGAQAKLAALAANGVRVTYVDIGKIGQQIQANPALYGFTQPTAICPLPACLSTPGLADQYVFYFDGVHLTAAGFAVVGRYALAQVAAPYQLRAQGDVTQRAAAAFGMALSGRLDLARGRGERETSAGKLALFLTGDFNRSTRDGDATSNSYDYDARGVTGGVEYGIPGGVVGAAVSYSRPHINGGQSDVKDESWAVGGYAGYQSGGLFAQGWGNYGWHDIDLRRTGVVGDVRADTKGRSYGAGARVGWLADLDSFSIGPVAGIAWAHGRVNGYTETGDGQLNLTVGRQTSETLVGSLGAEVRRTFAGSGATPYLRATAERNFDRDERSVRYAAVTASGIVNTVALDGVSRRTYAALQGGLSVAVMDGVSIDISGKTTIKRRDGNVSTAFAGLRVGF